MAVKNDLPFLNKTPEDSVPNHLMCTGLPSDLTMMKQTFAVKKHISRHSALYTSFPRFFYYLAV